MIGCIIQARLGSKRLPKKVMKNIDEKNMVIDYLIKQLQFAKSFQKILVATTHLRDDDDIILHLNLSKDIEIFRGSVDDVLDRFYNCAKKFGLKTIIRITGDNPLVDPNLIDQVVTDFKKHDCDYASNTINRTYPYGTEVEVFSYDALENAWKNAKLPSEREHVTPYITKIENGFKIFSSENKNDLSFLRYTIDRIDDLLLVKEIVKNIPDRPILLKNIIDLFQTKPEIFKINEHVKHDGYLLSLKEDEQYLKSLQENES